jgi:hypothetical protein
MKVKVEISDVPEDRIVIFDKEEQIIYGFEVLEYIVRTGRKQQVATFRGISLECYMAFLQLNPRFNTIKEVKTLLETLESRPFTSDLLRQVSDRIQLTAADAAYMQSIEDSHSQD